MLDEWGVRLQMSNNDHTQSLSPTSPLLQQNSIRTWLEETIEQSCKLRRHLLFFAVFQSDENEIEPP